MPDEQRELVVFVELCTAFAVGSENKLADLYL